MISPNETRATSVPSSTSKINHAALINFCKNVAADTQIHNYQLHQHHQDLEELQNRIKALELSKATQMGQDKIVGFLVGAIILSTLSILTTFFFRAPQASKPVLQGIDFTLPAMQAS
jgi:hypothetical protein